MSGRETEVLGLLGEHLSHAEIAARLFISVRTVESHVASLRRKLNVGTHRELVRLAAGYRAAVTGPGLAAPPAPPALPAPLTSFVGRSDERAALAAAVLAALGADESSSRPAQDALAAAVGERRALLVLDNCEHLVNAVAVLTERLLSACPNLSVLVTSRIRLVVPHETVYPVPGLSVPPPGREGGDAATLFAERAAAAGAPLPAGPAGTDDVAGSAAHRAAGICRALGGMPLAIELAAARLPSLGLDGLEAGLADQLSLLSGGARQQQRHRSLQDTLDWSYRLLDPREQAVLRRVAVFAAPFGLAAATVVVGYDPVEPARVADALGRLAEHSLLVPVASAGATRYHALEPVRQFAATRLTAIFTGVAAGQVARSLDHAERHYGLPFLREERYLGSEDLIAPAALAGQGDRALALGHQWRRGWEHAGRPVAVGRSMAPAAIAMVYGLRGDDAARAGWLAILAAVRGVAEDEAVRGSGCGEVFEAIVLLDRGEAHVALDLLATATAGDSSWRTRLWHQWMAALRAEAAVLARIPDAAGLVAQAEVAAGRNPVAAALARRAAALFRGDADGVLGTAAAFARARYPYQQARTLALAAAPRLYSSHEPGRPRAHPPGRTARRAVVRRRPGHGPADGARPAPVPDLAAAGRADGPRRSRPGGRVLHVPAGLGGMPCRRLRAGQVVRR